MDRRSFVRFVFAGASAGLVAPKLAFAEGAIAPLAGGLYYTKEAPGRWNKKVAGHVPLIETSRNANELAVRIITSHEMKAHEHYIVKHILLDQNYRFLDEKLFDPRTDKAPISEFTLPAYSGALYALSVCNKHDTWLNVAEV